MAATEPAAQSPARLRRLQLLLRALRHRNYRLFFYGQGISLVGTWMQQVAMSWLVYRLTGSAALLGVTGFAGQIPTFLFAPIAGVLADRCNRRRLLLLTQGLAMLQALFLALLVYAEAVAVWQLIVFSVLLGLINAFDIPVRQSFVVDLVDDREDLGNAIALNSSLVNAARLVGPSLGGILIALLGEEVCFLLNALSYLAVLAAIAAMRIPARPPQPNPQRLHRELRDGLLYIVKSPPIRAILMLVAAVSLFGMPYAVLLPIFASETLHGAAGTYGLLMAAAGFGALTSTIYLAARPSVLGLGRLLVRASLLFAVGIAGFALSRSLPMALVCIAIAGFGAMALIASSNTIIQTIVADQMRGRVMSFFAMAFMGMTPLGSLGAGAVAEAVGVQATLLAGSLACLLAGLFFTRQLHRLRDQVREIYRDKGILPVDPG